jgi:exodeoxyribonuclease VII small subunit
MAKRRQAAQTSPDPSSSDSESLSFEAALERLEGVVGQLEQGDLELEVALAAFEQGVALSRRCAGQLEQARRRIEILAREGDQWVERPFDTEDAPDASEEAE